MDAMRFFQEKLCFSSDLIDNSSLIPQDRILVGTSMWCSAEELALNSATSRPMPTLRRYVDDTFCNIKKGTKEEFLEHVP